MKNLLPILAALILCATPANANAASGFRLFLAPEGVQNNTPLGGISPTLGNPAVDASAGPQRLYIWGQVLGGDANQLYTAVSFNVVTTGSAAVVASNVWNYANTFTRWAASNPGTLRSGALLDVRLACNTVGFFGVRNENFANLDNQYDPVTESMVLGWIEVEGNGEIFLQVGEIGIIRTGQTWDAVALGIGDGAVPGNSFNTGSSTADATVSTVVACEPCDTDCDNDADAFDIEPFLDLLYVDGIPCSSCAGDTDGNGIVDAFDVSPLLLCFFPDDPPITRQETFRIFFDTSGNGDVDDAPHPGNATLSFGNPELPPGGGRLYIYGEFQNDGPAGFGQRVPSPNFDIEIDGGTITGAWNYNGVGQDQIFFGQRWTWAGPNPLVNPNDTTVSFTAANLLNLGLENGALHTVTDVQHDDSTGFGTTLLGYVDVESTDAASVWITVGAQGFAIEGGNGPTDLIFMGFDDAAVQAGGGFGRSAIPEATIPTLQAANDDCFDAIEIFEGSVGFENANATVDGPPLPIECDDGSGLDFVGDLWFSYAATCSGTLTVSTCNQATFDTSLVAYTGDCADLTLVACNDDGDACAGGTSRMDVPVTCGQSVLLRVGWGFGFLGSGTLSLTCTEEACPVSSADLNGDGVVDLRDYRLFQLEFGQP